MIDIKAVWLPAMERYAALIADDGVLRRSWLDGDRTETSIIDFSELIVQIFEDLDAESMRVRARAEIDDQEYLGLLDRFLSSLTAAEKAFSNGWSSAEVLASEEWKAAQSAGEAFRQHALRRA